MAAAPPTSGEPTSIPRSKLAVNVAHRHAATLGADPVDRHQRERGEEEGEGGAHSDRADDHDGEILCGAEQDQPDGLDQRGAHGASRRADPVGKSAGDQPRRHHRRGEDAEDRRAMPDPALVQAEDDERGNGGEPDDAERKGPAWPERFAGDERPAVDVLPCRVGLRQTGGDRRAEQGSSGGEGPDEMEAAGVLEQHPDRGTEGQAGPDREPVETDHPAPLLLRGHVDIPGRAGGEHRSLPGAQEEARDYQPRDPSRDEVETTRDRREQGPDDHGRLAAAAVGQVARDRAADDPREGEGAADDPDFQIRAVQAVLDVVGEDRERRAHRQQPEVGDDEDPGEARPLPPHRMPRSSARLILPLGVFGSSSANSTIRGYL